MNDAQAERLIDAAEKQADAWESIAKDFEMIRISVQDAMKIGGAIWRIGAAQK